MDIYSKVDHFCQKCLLRPRNPLFRSIWRFHTRKSFNRHSIQGSTYRKNRPGDPWIPDSTVKPHESESHTPYKSDSHFLHFYIRHFFPV